MRFAPRDPRRGVTVLLALALRSPCELEFSTTPAASTTQRHNAAVTVDQVITSDSEVQGGAVVFAGTRVPLKNLIDYLEAGDSLEEFLDVFPSVAREQAIAALNLLERHW